MTDDRAQQPDLDAEWEELARFLAGESSPEEQRRLRARLARDPERAALVQALDAALTPPDEAPLAAEEVERALASVMARREPVAPRVPASPGVIPLRRRATPDSPRAVALAPRRPSGRRRGDRRRRRQPALESDADRRSDAGRRDESPTSSTRPRSVASTRSSSPTARRSCWGRPADSALRRATAAGRES